MKWYKKQLDQILAQEAEASKSNEGDSVEKKQEQYFDLKGMKVRQQRRKSPVAASKLNRPKVDSH